MTGIVSVRPPSGGVWRVGRAPDPLAPGPAVSPSDLDQPNTGNRFDSPTGTYYVLYFGTSLEACFGETLARYRPDPAVIAAIGGEWRERGFMGLGDVPAEWRQRRIALRARFRDSGLQDGVQFVDVEAPETREILRVELAEMLAYYGYKDLDVATVRGADRRVTRWIGQWVYDQREDLPLYAGVRYLSRLDSAWECWAVFNDVRIEEVARQVILPTNEHLLRVANRYSLRVL